MTTSADLASQFRLPIGRATLGDQLRRHAVNQPDKPAFVTYDGQGHRQAVTYLELDRRANRAAHALAALGVARGDRVAVMSPNTVDVVAAYYGTLKLGAAFSGVNPALGAGEVRGQLEHAEPRVLLAADRCVAVAGEAVDGLDIRLLGLDGGSGADSFAALCAQSPETEPDAEVDELDVAMLVYTSGTEAAPKGVLIPHRNYLISTAPAWSWGLRTGPDDVWLFVMPFHTIAGLGSMTTLTVMGATLVLPSTTDAGSSLRYLRDEQVTVVAQTPTFYLALAQHADFGRQAVGTVVRCMRGPRPLPASCGARTGASRSCRSSARSGGSPSWTTFPTTIRPGSADRSRISRPGSSGRTGTTPRPGSCCAARRR
jgi:acyl-CoA synthetase (AMP-forming)/AMP-acid ligase II